MDKFIVNLHSVVDVITNSSTVIYTGVNDNAIAIIENLIDDVLQQAGSNMTAADLYKIELVREPEANDFDTFDEYDDAYDTFQNEESQVNVDTEAGVSLKSKVVITSINRKNTVVSDKLAKIFFVQENFG